MTPIDYPSLLATLAIDLVLLFLLAYVFFYRRHQRRDVFVALCLINITLYVLGGALGTFTISIGVGFALFSVISIFRLRSVTLGWVEIVYLLVALAGTLLAPALSPAQAATQLTIADIYNPLKIVRADLTIPNTSITALRNSPKVYTPASMKLEVEA